MKEGLVGYTQSLTGGFEGHCDHEGCQNVVTSISEYGDGRIEKLCDEHRREQVQAQNLALYRRQKLEREQVGASDRKVAIVLHVSKERDEDGNYLASLENPINSCDSGFGRTPYRALSELGRKISENADKILQKVVEHEMEIRVADHASRSPTNE